MVRSRAAAGLPHLLRLSRLQLCHLGPWQSAYALEGQLHERVTLVDTTRKRLEAVKDLACKHTQSYSTTNSNTVS
jgi:hypothetical protein